MQVNPETDEQDVQVDLVGPAQVSEVKAEHRVDRVEGRLLLILGDEERLD